MNAAARTLTPLLMTSLALAAAPAAAQPGASWTETGFVEILVRIGGVLAGRQATQVLESDVIESIDVGDTGVVGNQDSGTLYIEGIGTPDVPRDLGEVFVLVGQLEVNNVIADAAFIRIGSTIDTANTDPSDGTMVVRLSDVREQVVVRKGLVTCQASSMSVAVLDAGMAQIDDCLIRSISGTGLSQTSIVGSTILGVGFRGTTNVSDSSIESLNGSVVEGTITIGNSAPVFWDDSGTIVVGQNVHTTDLIVSRVTNLVQNGTLNENGGTLIVPEAGSFASALAAALTPALVRRRLARTARS